MNLLTGPLLLSSKATVFQVEILYYYYFPDDSTPEVGLSDLGALLPKLSALHRFAMRDFDAALLLPNIRACASLKRIDLASYRISAGGMKKIVSVLKDLPPSVKWVNLDWGRNTFEERPENSEAEVASLFREILDSSTGVTLLLSKGFKVSGGHWCSSVEEYIEKGREIMYE